MRRETAGTAIRFGGFVAVCLAFTLWLAFTIGNVRLFADTYSISATFDDVSGLLVNDNVKVAGVVVGKVTGIELDRGRATVHMSVLDHIKVPSDSTASVRWRNLLGQRYVYLNPGGASTIFESGAHIVDTTSVVDLGELFNRLGPIVAAIDPAKVNEFLDALDGALSGNEVSLRASIGSLATLSDTLASRDEVIGRLVENSNVVAGAIVSREAQIRSTLDNLVLLAKAFDENIGVVDGAITELGDFSAHMSNLLVGNRAEIDSIVASLDTLVAVVASKLPTVEHLVTGLDEGVKRLFTSSRFGTFLNQIIPCGAIGPVDLSSRCVTSTNQTGGANPAASNAQAHPTTDSRTVHGADAIVRLLGMGS